MLLERICLMCNRMSAFAGKADIAFSERHVWF